MQKSILVLSGRLTSNREINGRDHNIVRIDHLIKHIGMEVGVVPVVVAVPVVMPVQVAMPVPVVIAVPVVIVTPLLKLIVVAKKVGLSGVKRSLIVNQLLIIVNVMQKVVYARMLQNVVSHRIVTLTSCRYIINKYCSQ